MATGPLGGDGEVPWRPVHQAAKASISARQSSAAVAWKRNEGGSSASARYGVPGTDSGKAGHGSW